MEVIRGGEEVLGFIVRTDKAKLHGRSIMVIRRTRGLNLQHKGIKLDLRKKILSGHKCLQMSIPHI